MTTERKNVNWTDWERVDAPDMRAMSDLKDEDLRELLLATMEPGTNGRVIKGFDEGVHAGLAFMIASGDGIAVDPAGNLLGRPAGTTSQVDLTGSSVNYVYAYLDEVASDQKRRRFVNPVDGAKTYSNVNTRLTKRVKFHTAVGAAWSGANPLANFLTSAVIGGKVRSLLALYCVETGVAGISVVHDCRSFWGIAANATLEAAANSRDLPFAFTPSTASVRNTLRGVAQALRGIVGGNHPWWEATTKTLQDLVDFLTTPHIWEAVQSMRGAVGSDAAPVAFDGNIDVRKLQTSFGLAGGFWVRVYSEGSGDTFVITYNAWWRRSDAKWVSDQTEYDSWMLKYSVLAGVSLFRYGADDKMAYGMTWDNWGTALGSLGFAGLAAKTLTAVGNIVSSAGDVRAQFDVWAGARVWAVGDVVSKNGTVQGNGFKRNIALVDRVKYIPVEKAIVWGDGSLWANTDGYPAYCKVAPVSQAQSIGLVVTASLPIGAKVTKIGFRYKNYSVQQTADWRVYYIKPNSEAKVAIGNNPAEVLAANANWTGFNTGAFANPPALGADQLVKVCVLIPYLEAASEIDLGGISITYTIPTNTEILPNP